ncbi:SPOR domain-containing protein [Flavobacterium sp.]|uniref:SPOR domain-containing protein n=1 Tax=Flavobacterium sp. TaxID=239 RepID=UPI0038FCC8D7
MRFIRLSKIKLTIIFIVFCNLKIIAQNQNAEITQNPKFEQLLNEKRKLNPSIIINDYYKIQIFSGDSESAKNNLNEFKQEFKTIDATIVFYTPNYKVWVGNFKTRIEAEKNLIKIKNKFTNVLLIRPNRNTYYN